MTSYTQGEWYEVEDPHDTDDLSREVASTFSGSTSLEATRGYRTTRCSETGAAQIYTCPIGVDVTGIHVAAPGGGD